MEDKEKKELYYKPDVEELHIGWEGEASFMSYGGYVIFDFANDTVENHPPIDKEAAKFWTKFFLIEKESWNNGNNQRNLETALMLLKDNRLRGKYLDKSDIKELGWQNVKDVEGWGNREPKYFWGANLKNAMLGYNYKDHSLVITFIDPTLSIDGTQDQYSFPGTKDGQFRGYCKSKNELKFIMKWLKIEIPQNIIEK